MAPDLLFIATVKELEKSKFKEYICKLTGIKKNPTTSVVGGLCLAALTANAFGATNFTNLYSFSPFVHTNSAGVYTNFDGANSQAGLVLSGNTLYGTTTLGGTNGTGTVFKINTNGTAFSVLYEFNDHGTPAANLVLARNILYGTTKYGGTNKTGTVFEIGTNGIEFTNLFNFAGLTHTNSIGNFTNSDGANSTAGLLLAGSTLYGTAAYGGTNGNGTIFRINTNGMEFTNLYSFSALLHTNSFGTFTNRDGANPAAGLALYGGTLYGTAEFGGAGGSGTVFAINTNGVGFTNLYSFSPVIHLTNSDGAYTVSGMLFSGGNLFGTTQAGGTNGNGTLFAISTNGGSFTNFHTFGTAFNYTNADGAKPTATLTLLNNTLYGTTQLGGSGGAGTIFSVGTNGSSFENLYNFTPISTNTFGVYTNKDGDFPSAVLVASGSNSLYGTTLNAGTGGNGGVYVLSPGAIPLAIPLNIQSASNFIILTWGNPAFSLQSATNVTGIYTTISNAASPYTNTTLLSPRAFFRLQAF